jgi:hypothetical protein
MSYVELQVTTHFSFLRGASSAEELFVIRPAILALTQFWCSGGHVAPMRRA